MRLMRVLKRFARQRDGSVAIMFGLSLVGLALAAGLALDYARAFSVESALRSDLDAAVLGAASSMADPNAVQAAASAYFDQNWKQKHGVSDVSLTVVKTTGNTLIGTVTATVPTTLMRLGGFDTIALQAVSEVEVSGGNVELSLVLDTTGSMAGSKLDGLKLAAKSLIATAYEAPDADQHVKIGVVPFAQYVNVGMENRSMPWMSVPPDGDIPQHYCGDGSSPILTTTNCRTETVHTFQDGQAYSYDQQVCDHTYGPPTYQCSNWVDHVAWSGCVGSRANPLDTLDENYATPVPGLMNTACGLPIQKLTNDQATLIAKIDSLVAAGYTYIPTGLMWGWTLLSNIAPFDDAVDYGARVDGKKVKKVMVLMTDGFNTISPLYPSHNGSDTAQANALTAELCTNIKSKDIELYTVAFEVNDNSIKDILETCATSSSKFFDARDSSELVTVFRNIAKDFTPLRLAR